MCVCVCTMYLISSILGRGWRTIILSLALVSTLGVSTKQPLTWKKKKKEESGQVTSIHTTLSPLIPGTICLVHLYSITSPHMWGLVCLITTSLPRTTRIKTCFVFPPFDVIFILSMESHSILI